MLQLEKESTEVLPCSVSSEAPLRVCHVLPGPPDPQRMVFATEQISSLSALGVMNHSVFLWSRTSPVVVLYETRRLRKEIREFRPNLVHAHYGTVTAMLAALSVSIPIVITYRGSDLNPCPSISSIRSRLGRFLSQIAAYRAARIVCVSAELRGRLWRGGSEVRIIPTGVDLSRFRPISRDVARRQLGWPPGRPVVLFNVGDDPLVKRKDLALAAVAEARKMSLDFDFVELNGRVAHADISTYLNAADCLLVTSDWEGSPNIVKEAVACDLPVVTVDAGDVRERLAKVTPSIIVERRPSSIAKGLAEILRDPRRSNGHETVADISSENVARQLVAVYREVLTA
ncbi:MAG: glycosyltransferase family 4 protein [Nitrospiraceae bacterium]|nr:glycosyltransferase family 4 protein [Nitrospiraceae bacterium]